MIGWENNQGAYYINQLQDQIDKSDKDISDLSDDIGKLSSLTTSEKKSIVGAVNEVDSHADTAMADSSSALEEIGTLTNLKTTAKTDMVSSVNEIFDAMLPHHSTQLGSSDDLDTLKNLQHRGTYCVGASVGNAPASYCTLLVIPSYNNGYCTQVCFTDSNIYIRKYSTAWTAWKVITASAIS